jgi:hypothetical protein
LRTHKGRKVISPQNKASICLIAVYTHLTGRVLCPTLTRKTARVFLGKSAGDGKLLLGVEDSIVSQNLNLETTVTPWP